MKVLFIYSDVAITNQKRFQHGVAYLSSSLKSDGIDTGLLHIYSPLEKEGFLRRIREFKPDMLAYSSLTNQYPQVRLLAGWSGPLGIFTLYGGLHPTVAPQQCIDTPGIDAICLGEGDVAIRDFVHTFSSGGDITKVQNFWVRQTNGASKNSVRPLIENLDTLPLPDYDLFPYEDTDDFKVSRSITVQASRGCLYSCTYCCNHYLRSLYPNKERYLRFRSVESVLAELKFLLSKYPRARLVRFTDDALSSQRGWFEEFAHRYPREIGLPYSVNDHPHNIDADIARLYRNSGCIALSMGIESGNPYIRKQIMRRPFSNEDIIHAFRQIKKAGIDTSAFNIVGVPFETMSTILDTIKLNAQCSPVRYANAYFQPFLETEAAKMCYEAGWKIKELPGSFFEEPVVELPGISREQVIFGFKYFGLLVLWYKLLYRLSAEGGENAAMRFSDKIVSSRFMPYRFLNAVMINRMDIKKRFPRLGHYLTMIKRFFFRHKY